MCKNNKEVHVKSVGRDEWYTEWYTCPNCDISNIYWGASFCPECGVKINTQSYNK